MEEDGGLLSQDEVDALFKQATGKSIAWSGGDKGAAQQASSEAAETKGNESESKPSSSNGGGTGQSAPTEKPETRPQRPASQSPATRPAAASPGDQGKKPESSGDRGSLADLQKSLAGLSRQIAAMEKRITSLEKASPKKHEIKKIDIVNKDVASIKKHIQQIESGLLNTPDFNMRSHFTCGKCGSEGAVSVLHRCNQCKNQGWWGWLPKKKRRGQE